MKGKHINVAQMKSEALRHKILCVIMAISLVTLMIPHGLRAHAEETFAQDPQVQEKAIQEESESQEAVEEQSADEETTPADEFTEGGENKQANESENAEDCVVSIVADPEDSATFDKTEVTVPKGSLIYSSAASTNKTIEIWSEYWGEILDTITCTPNAGNTFQSWSTGYHELTEDNYTLTANITVPEPPAEDCVVSIVADPEDSATFDKTEVTVPKGSLIYSSAASTNKTIEIWSEYWGEILDTITCTPNAGNTFQSWSTGYQELTDDTYTLTAYINVPEPPTSTLTFHTVGNGHLEISYDSENWKTLDTEVPMSFGEGAGYYNGDGTGNMYVSTHEGVWICVIRAVPGDGYKFSSWDVKAGSEKHVITGDDSATATFTEEEPITHTVYLSTEGSGSGEFLIQGQAPVPDNKIEVNAGDKLYTYDNGWFYIGKEDGEYSYQFKANEDSIFSGWNLNLSEEDPLVITQDVDLKAKVNKKVTLTLNTLVGGEESSYGYWTLEGDANPITSLEVPDDAEVYFYNYSSEESAISICTQDWKTVYYEIKWHKAAPEGYAWKGWSLDNFTLLTTNKTLSALMEAPTHTVYLSTEGSGSGEFLIQGQVPVPDNKIEVNAGDKLYMNDDVLNEWFYIEKPDGTWYSYQFKANEDSIFSGWNLPYTEEDPLVINDDVDLKAKVNKKVTLTLNTLVGGEESSYGYWTLEGDANPITSLEVPNDAEVYFYNYSSEESAISICRTDWSVTYYQIKWHKAAPEGYAWTGWSLENRAPLVEDTTLSAILTLPMCTVSLAVEGNGSAHFDNYDWESEQVIGDHITSLEVPKGFTLWHDSDLDLDANEIAYGYTDEYNFFIPVGYLVCHVDDGAFIKWSSTYQVLTEDTFTLTATVIEICKVNLDIVTESSAEATFVDSEGNEIDYVEVPQGTGVVYAFSQTYPVINFYSHIGDDWIDLEEVTCVYDDSDTTFYKWDPSYYEVNDEDEITVNAYLECEPAISFSGTVFDEYRNPVAGAHVTFTPDVYSSNSNTQFIWETYSNDEGNYQLRLPKGQAGTLSAHKEGYPVSDHYFDEEFMSKNHEDVDPILADCYIFTVETYGNPAKVEYDETGEGDYIPGNKVEVPKGAYFRASNGLTPGFGYIYVFVDEVYFTSFKVSSDIINQRITWGCETGTDIIIPGDMTVVAAVYSDIDYTHLIIDPSDTTAHQNFDIEWYVNDELLYSWTEDSIYDEFFDTTTYSFDENGVITLVYYDPYGNESNYETTVIKPNPADRYLFDSYTDAYSGIALEPNTVYTIDTETGDLNWNVNYKPIPSPAPEPEPIVPAEQVNAQTGDTSSCAVACFAILALVGCAYVALRRQKTFK